MPIYVEYLVPERLRSTGQAGLLLAGASVGGILSSTLAGSLMDGLGIDAVYLIGGLGGVAVGLLGMLMLPRDAGLPGEAQDDFGNSVGTLHGDQMS